MSPGYGLSDILQCSVAAIATRWQYPILQSARIRICLFIIVAAYSLSRAVTGLIGMRLYAHDAFWLLDGAWRIMNGQRPQMDFSSMQGFLAYLPAVIGLCISKGSVWGFGYGQALMGLLLPTWMYLIGRKRLQDVSLLLICLVTCFAAAAPFSLGESPFQLSPGTTYNRYGYCCLALVLVEAAEEAQTATRELFGSVSTGAITAALFFLKITFFAAALFLFVLLFPCKQQAKSRFVATGAGFAIVFLICLAYYSFNLAPMFNDLLLVARARHLRLVGYTMDQNLAQAAVLLVLCFCAAGLASKYAERVMVARIIVAGTVATACAVLCVFGNFEFYGLAFAPFVALLITDLLVRYTPGLAASDNFTKGSLLLVGVALASSAVFGGLFSMGVAYYERFHANAHIPHMKGPRLSGFATDGQELWYAGWVNDGIDLLERLRKPEESIMCLDFSNPFSYGLAAKPAPGGTNGLHYKNSFNDTAYESAAALFGHADLVMVPKTFSDYASQESVPRIYGPYLHSHFHQIGESKEWILYRRDA